MKKGKKYVEASKKVDKEKNYEIKEAIKLIKETSITKFDSTVEVAFKLNVDTKKSDQQIRGSIVLPHGTGKTKKTLVLAKAAAAENAKKAGADYVGDTDLIEKIQKESWFDYDVIIATPEMMPELGKIGMILGPKGLMPNPKSGTVTDNPAKVIEDIQKGMIEYRTDTFGNIHSVIGKVSFDNKKLEENLTYFIDTIIKSRPNALKGIFIKNVTISSTMGPGIKINLNSFDI
ncbi:MAG TPA: 50S ribosomal protein L1 [Mollicutes bacterium]|jgi:large subunit ribosomal protein L1|nr:50S ribosomal protein L1 [Mollicutes bacterium]